MTTHTLGTTTFVVYGNSVLVCTPSAKFRVPFSNLAEAALENGPSGVLRVDLEPEDGYTNQPFRELPASDVRAFLGRMVAAARVAKLEEATDEELFQLGREEEIRNWAQL